MDEEMKIDTEARKRDDIAERDVMRGIKRNTRNMRSRQRRILCRMNNENQYYYIAGKSQNVTANSSKKRSQKNVFRYCIYGIIQGDNRV